MTEPLRFLLALAVLLAVPFYAAAQTASDTVQVVVPFDKNCSDFASQQQAQGWYDAIEIFYERTVGYDAIDDPHGLDADGDGQPCEGLRYGKVEDLGEGYAVRYELVPAEYDCPTVESPFTIDVLKAQAVTAATDSIPYRGPDGVWPRWECVHTISVLVNR